MENIGVGICQSNDDKPFDPQMLHAKYMRLQIKLHEDTDCDFLFIDDCVHNTIIQSDMSVDLFSKACKDSTSQFLLRRTKCYTKLHLRPHKLNLTLASTTRD